MFERFTDDARAVVITTQELCPRLGATEVGPVHLLLALTQDASSVREVLAAHGLTDAAVVSALELERGDTTPPPRPLDDEDAEALRSLGIDLDAIRRAVEERFGEGALDGGPDDRTEAPEAPEADDDLVAAGPPRGRLRFGAGRVRFGRGAKKVLELAVREAIRQRSREITAAHVALGVLRTDDPDVRRVLWQLNVDQRALRVDLEGRMRRSA